MKEKIHPDLKETVVNCICGAKYKLKSVKQDMKVEVCANCHPFYSGKTKRAITGGRIERFNTRYGLKDS